MITQLILLTSLAINPVETYVHSVQTTAPQIQVYRIIESLPKIEPVEITFDNSVDTYA